MLLEHLIELLLHRYKVVGLINRQIKMLPYLYVLFYRIIGFWFQGIWDGNHGILFLNFFFFSRSGGCWKLKAYQKVCSRRIFLECFNIFDRSSTNPAFAFASFTGLTRIMACWNNKWKFSVAVTPWQWQSWNMSKTLLSNLFFVSWKQYTFTFS